MGLDQPLHELQIASHDSTMDRKHGFLGNIGKGASQIQIARFIKEQGVLILPWQKCHAERIAQPIAGLADPDRQRSSTRDVCLGQHSNAKSVATFFADFGTTVLAMIGSTFLLLGAIGTDTRRIGKADGTTDAVSCSSAHFWR